MTDAFDHTGPRLRARSIFIAITCLTIVRRDQLRLAAGCAVLAALVASPAMAGCNSGSVVATDLLNTAECQADASGFVSTAVGHLAKAQGNYATAYSNGAFANGENATALGYYSGARTAVAGATSVGTGAGFGGAGFYATAVGGGIPYIIKDPTSPRATGDYSVAIGGGDGSTFTPTSGATINLNGALATGFVSTAVGAAARASGGGSSAFGLGSQATANDSSAYGDFSAASGGASIAIGLFSTASGASSVAIGSSSAAAGNFSTAVGTHASASNGSSSAYGQISRASGLSSSAFGTASFASGSHGVALGGLSKAGGVDKSADATAIGYGAQATAASSVALGAGSVAGVVHAVSIGSVGNERRIMNVAKAQLATDAVNLKQVKNMIAAAKLTPASPAAENGTSSVTPLQVAVTRPSEHARADNQFPGLRGETSRSKGETQHRALEPSEIVGWANMNQNGTLSGSRNIGGNARHGIGRYEIAFKGTTPKRCTYQITLAGVGYASVKAGPGPGSLNIETRNHQGVLTDSGFYLMAVC